jgi:hypothetical protein
MDCNKVCPFDDFVNPLAVLERYSIPNVGKFPIFKEQEIMFFGEGLEFRYQSIGKGS